MIPSGTAVCLIENIRGASRGGDCRATTCDPAGVDMPTPTPMARAAGIIRGTRPSAITAVNSPLIASATCPSRRPPKRRMKQPTPSMEAKPATEMSAISTPRKAGSSASAGSMMGAATGMVALVIEEKVCCASMTPAAV